MELSEHLNWEVQGTRFDYTAFVSDRIKGTFYIYKKVAKAQYRACIWKILLRILRPFRGILFEKFHLVVALLSSVYYSLLLEGVTMQILATLLHIFRYSTNCWKRGIVGSRLLYLADEL